MFPSYKTIVSRNNALFESNPLNGLTVSQSFRSLSPVIFTYAINLPYLKVPFITDKFGQAHPVDPITRIFQSSIIIPYPNFQMILGVGSLNSVQLSYTPKPWINFSSSIQSNLAPLASISMSNSFSNITLVSNPNFGYDWDTNIFLSAGFESLYACIQLSHEKKVSNSFSKSRNSLINLNSLLLGHQKNDFRCQWLTIVDAQKVLANVISFQNKFKDIKEKVPYIEFGAALQISSSSEEEKSGTIYNFISNYFSKFDATIAWKTEVNKCTIHSLIKSSGVVQSSLKMKPNSVCEMTVSGKLDHKASDYTLGISLNFL